jgi:lantibiotic leader peptide-processing serine protease
MHRIGLGIVAALVATVLAGSGIVAEAAPQVAEQAARAWASDEYVVVYAEGNAFAAEQAIIVAGGTVVDRNAEVDLMLVDTDNAGFADQVRGAQGVTGVALNHSIGTAQPNMPHRFAEERPQAAVAGHRSVSHGHEGEGGHGSDPLAPLQWDMTMIGATADGAHRRATGKGVTVGIIDTGVDASHPDIAPNFSHALSINFTVDRPDIDGPCDTPTCVDPADVDQGGHGTHVAGIVAGASNGIGITGVAPDATIVNVRAGQDSGYFFVWETVKALVYAGDKGLDVANMSFYTDPWLYNCASRADYVSGDVTDAQLAEQATIRQVVLAATEYAHDHGVTLVAAAGNGHANYALPQRSDATSPDYPPGTEVPRVVTSNCLDLPSEAPDVISVSSVGPSGTKSDFSNYGLGSVELSAPGGWFRDGIGTPTFQTPANEILSSYPLELAIEEGLFDPATQEPTDDTSVADCSVSPCAFYTYLQGTSMASPHVAGVAALIVQADGEGNKTHGFSLAPDTVRSILLGSATDHACPAGGSEIYTDEGRPAEFDAVCDGTTANNGLYGEGIVNAAAAVAQK